MADPQMTVPLAPVLDEYIRMHSELTLTVTQLRVLVAERDRELADVKAKLAALEGQAQPWPEQAGAVG
ncbi:hypothetical protein [Kitasatospora camelliae]|uniref:Uncharacterized protein n=1 Tax=Kitasatospora camelliae TaxID=3156397 RepID=A0AAU8K6N4_9ACTN